MASTAAGKQRIPKVAKVKNKAPADLQITAEQLLREAKERELELLPPPPRQKISDEEELADYKLRKRKTFEDNIRKNRTVVTNWIKYAQWEESLKEIQRARSLYERALDVDHRNVTLWLKYAEMEMKNRQVNHARNIWDRAVTILPRINAFWYKYTYMEEMLSNVAGCRQVFERWMEWEPEEQAWHSYINFELRYKEVDAARAVYEKFVMVHPEIKNWIKYARFEDRHGYTAHARRVYERAVEFYGEEHMKEPLFVAFARFEEAQKEFDRVRVIYKYALDRIPKQSSQELFKNYTMFEKKYGDRRGIEDVIVSKRRFQYEEEVKANPHNYDAWFDYLRLVESDCEAESVREVYERAIANVPLLPEKRHWRRYIYLWINFALFEELEMKVLLPINKRELFERYKLFMASVRCQQSFNIAMENLKQIVDMNKMDPDRTRQVYQGCLELIPHKKFTFSKIWLLFAQFEIRQKNLTAARKVLGMSIGKCPKNKLFKGYIELELQLREFDRCRKLYEKFLEFAPENCTTWMKFAELETILGDVERSRAIYELAVGQPRLDMPEVLWKSYIDFEIEQEECSRTRNLYRRLLQRTQHVKVWISFAKFELSVEGKERVSRCRRVYEEGNRSLRSCEEKEERVMLLEAWRDFEDPFGNEDSRERVQKLMPSRVKKRRKVQTDDGSDAGWEEYYDYIFPEDSANQPNLKLLSMAKMWKQQQYMEAHGIASTAQGAPQWVDEPMEEDEQRESDAQTSVQRQPGNEKGTVTARDKSDDDDGGDGREERGESVATGDGDSRSVNEGEGESSGETSKKTPVEMEVGGGGDDELVSTKAIKKEQENIGGRDPDKDRDETEDS